MDFLLIFYCLFFVFILIAPTGFVFLKYKDNESSLFGESPDEYTSNLKEERLILLSNLADLKAEEETGKLKHGEFQDLSKDILNSLTSIDTRLVQTNKVQTSEIPNNQNTSSTTKQNTKLEDFNFCPSCGSQLVNSAKFCHSCGYKLVS